MSKTVKSAQQTSSKGNGKAAGKGKPVPTNDRKVHPPLSLEKKLEAVEKAGKAARERKEAAQQSVAACQKIARENKSRKAQQTLAAAKHNLEQAEASHKALQDQWHAIKEEMKAANRAAGVEKAKESRREGRERFEALTTWAPLERLLSGKPINAFHSKLALASMFHGAAGVYEVCEDQEGRCFLFLQHGPTSPCAKCKGHHYANLSLLHPQDKPFDNASEAAIVALRIAEESLEEAPPARKVEPKQEAQPIPASNSKAGNGKAATVQLRTAAVIRKEMVAANEALNAARSLSGRAKAKEIANWTVKLDALRDELSRAQRAVSASRGK